MSEHWRKATRRSHDARKSDLVTWRRPCGRVFRIFAFVGGSRSPLPGGEYEGYASKRRRRGCPKRPNVAKRSRSCNRTLHCRDFPAPWSRNSSSGRNGLGWRLRAGPLPALQEVKKKPRQRREFWVRPWAPQFGCSYPNEKRASRIEVSISVSGKGSNNCDCSTPTTVADNCASERSGSNGL